MANHLTSKVKVNLSHFALAGLFFRDVPLEITRTLLVEKIPEHMCKEDLVKRHFREAYPALTVTSVRLAYDVRELMQVSQKLRDANDAIKEAKKHNENHPEQPLMMKPVSCSRFCHVLCFCTEKVSIFSCFIKQGAEFFCLNSNKKNFQKIT